MADGSIISALNYNNKNVMGVRLRSGHCCCNHSPLSALGYLSTLTFFFLLFCCLPSYYYSSLIFSFSSSPCVLWCLPFHLMHFLLYFLLFCDACVHVIDSKPGAGSCPGVQQPYKLSAQYQAWPAGKKLCVWVFLYGLSCLHHWFIERIHSACSVYPSTILGCTCES